MQSARDLWAAHAPKIASAREKDSELISLAFLPIVITVGSFEIAPLTIERLLWLEQLKSPFLMGKEVKKKDVLAFLWIFNPNFKVGEKYGKAFCRRHYFIFWKKYAAVIGEILSVYMEMMGANSKRVSKKGSSGSSADWLPQMLDGFASQYHWAERDIMNLPIMRAMLYGGAMAARLSGKQGIKWSPNADKARADYLAEANPSKQ
jgi:hypothetical protein